MNADELPEAVAKALTDPPQATSRTVHAAGYEWHLREWGDPTHHALLLLHGVASNSETFWRVGPALAVGGSHVLAADMPGHGVTGGWRGRHRWSETAADLVGLIQALGLDEAELVVVGHSWGAVTAAHLPMVGYAPARLVLIDPPALTVAEVDAITRDPTERRYENLADALAAVRGSGAGWSEGDIRAKANALTQMDEAAVRAIYLQNGDWDGGLAPLTNSAARGVPTWIIRGEPEHGGLLGDDALARLAALVGADHTITIPGASHSPQRTHPEATTAAILRVLVSEG